MTDLIAVEDGSENIVGDQYGIPLQGVVPTNASGITTLAPGKSVTKTITIKGVPASPTQLYCAITTNSDDAQSGFTAYTYPEVNALGTGETNNQTFMPGMEGSQYFADPIIVPRPALQLNGTSAIVNWTVRNDGSVPASFVAPENGSLHASDTVQLYNADTGAILINAVTGAPMTVDIAMDQGASSQLLNPTGTITKSYTFTNVPTGVPVAVRVTTNTGASFSGQSGKYVIEEKNAVGTAQTNNTGLNGDVTPIQVTNALLIYDGVAPSKLEFAFDQSPVATLTTDDLVLQNRSTGTTIPSSAMSLVFSSTNIADITFPGLPGGQLPDGDYDAKIAAGAVADPSGNALAANFIDSFILVKAGGAIALAQSSTKVSQLFIGSGGQLGMETSPLVVDYASASVAGSWNGSAYTGILGLVQSGRNGGSWNGGGIVTSMTAARAPSTLTTIGVAEASQALGIAGSATQIWNGQTVDATSVLVGYTYSGDSNLDGKINGDDYFNIDAHAGLVGGAVSYFNGDFNYDGKINADDYFLIDSNYSKSQTAMAVPLSVSTAVRTTPMRLARAALPPAVVVVVVDSSSADDAAEPVWDDWAAV